MFNMFLRRAVAFVVDVIFLVLIFFGNFMFMVTSLNLMLKIQ